MEEELIKRILPHSDDAERSVIGCMMMNREAIMIPCWNYTTKENR